MLTFVFLLLGLKTHIIITLILCTLNLAVLRSSNQHLPSIQEFQSNVIILLSMGIIESIVSFIQFIKAFLYEIRVDDGFLIGQLALILLSFLSSHYQAHPRTVSM